MTITNVYQRKARALGLTVEPSKTKGKKLDVYKNGEFQASIGAANMMDYERYLRQEGKEVADKRRAAFRARHVHRTTKYRDGKLTAAWLADRILW